MSDTVKIGRKKTSEWARRSLEFGRLPRGIKLGRNILIAIVAFGALGYSGVPVLTRYLLTQKVAAALSRPVTVGEVDFNPYTLRMSINKLSIGERGTTGQFVDIANLRVRLSWASLWRFAPIIREFFVQQPTLRVIRTAQNRFNFSDLIESSQPAPSKTAGSMPSKPFRFAVSNIQLAGGTVLFDDQVVGKQHTVNTIQLGIPFVASLPAYADIFVQPLLEMAVDGTPLRIVGQTKPFGGNLESIVYIKFERLDLHQYIGYLPHSLPIKVPHGALSSDVRIHFRNQEYGPAIKTEGTVALDDLGLNDASDAPLLELKHFIVVMRDLRPLDRVAHLSAVGVDGLTARLIRNPDGTTNFTSLSDSGAKSAEKRPPATEPQATEPSPDVTVDSLKLTESAVQITDRSNSTPAAVTLQGIQLGLRNFSTSGQTAAFFDMNANLDGGGTVAAKGSINLPQSQATTDISLGQIDLPALQAFAQSVVAGSVASGKFGAQGVLVAHFGKQFNVHAEPARLSLDNLEVRDPRGRETPVQLKHLAVSIGQVDLATKQATVSEARTDGLNLLVRRGHHGRLNLLSFLRGSQTLPPKGTPSARTKDPEQGGAAGTPSPPWRYRIESIVLENTQAKLEDDSAPSKVQLSVAPINIHLTGISSDFAKPFELELDGSVNREGTFKVAGKASIAPLTAELKIDTKKVDLAFVDPYLSRQLNTTIASAALTLNGAANFFNERGQIHARYRGAATIGNVQLLDKLTLKNFARWSALSAKGINAEYGAGVPKVRIEALSLSNFYARIILNSNGRLNLADITTGPAAAQTSLTEAHPTTAPPAPATPPPAASTSVSPAPPIPADVEISQTSLQGGYISYTDNFIKPNYSANLTDIGGKIGAVGTRTTQAAEVTLEGKIDSSAPLNIDGSLNPLAPMAFVDVKAKADGIELTRLTPYSTKYTGYPILQGTMVVDVHYLLDQQKLTAENHIIIDQLTFGDRVENSTAANLPVRLAVAILKDSNGQINVDIPISGSLSDPQFSLGGVLLHALMNLIAKAVTSPFALLGAAFGGNPETLGFVEFAPGYATLSAESQSRLATVTKVLEDRTALHLAISGRVDPRYDTQGLRNAIVMHQIAAQKLKDLGSQASGADLNSVQVGNEEYDKYLERAYKAAKFPKPTNFVGLTKSLPPDEMKKLMLTNTHVDEQSLAKLADARANAVRAALSKQIDPTRLLVTAPKLNADGITDQGKTTRADLSLQ